MFGGSGGQERNRIAVALTLASGETLHGNIFGHVSGKLRETVNGADAYLEFEKRDGTIVFIAKRNIAEIRGDEVPKTDQLTRRATSAQNFDPFTMLGVERNAGPNEIKTAYWSKARLYHPDKFAGKEVPKEIVDYMSAMFMRIHAAYKELAGENAPV
jgi:DnaJ domain